MAHRAAGSLGILSEGLSRERGTTVWEQNVAAADALAELVRSTLGPNGRDKLLVGSDGTAVVTNDGAAILDRVDVEHPTARAILDVAATQKRRVGDGTTTAVLLTDALLAEAAALRERGLHPTSIAAGYQRAAQRLLATIDSLALEIDSSDERVLRAVARTAITGRWDDESTAFMAGLAVDAIEHVTIGSAVDRSNVRLKPVVGGALRDSTVIPGLVIDLAESSTTVSTRAVELPRHIDDATVAVVDGQLSIDSADAVSTVTVSSPAELQRLRDHERAVYESYVDRFVQTGVDVVFCQQSIDDTVKTLLAREGVLPVERTRRDELHALERATGSTAVTAPDELTLDRVGFAGTVERRSVAGTELTVVTDCIDAEPISVLLRGGTAHVLDETKRIVTNCLDVAQLALETDAVLPGGGAPEIGLAADLREYARRVSGREQLAVEGVAAALESVPRTLARNTGLDPIDVLAELRREHAAGADTAGVDVTTGETTDLAARNVLEPLSVKRRAIVGAVEAANTLIRIDDSIAAEGGADSTVDRGHGHGHEHDHGASGLRHDSGGYPWAIGH